MARTLLTTAKRRHRDQALTSVAVYSTVARLCSPLMVAPENAGELGNGRGKRGAPSIVPEGSK